MLNDLYLKAGRHPTPLQLFLPPEDQHAYRPFFVSAERHDDGEINVSFSLVKTPDAFACDTANAFDMVIRMLDLARQFRSDRGRASRRPIGECH